MSAKPTPSTTTATPSAEAKRAATHINILAMNEESLLSDGDLAQHIQTAIDESTRDLERRLTAALSERDTWKRQWEEDFAVRTALLSERDAALAELERVKDQLVQVNGHLDTAARGNIQRADALVAMTEERNQLMSSLIAARESREAFDRKNARLSHWLSEATKQRDEALAAKKASQRNCDEIYATLRAELERARADNDPEGTGMTGVLYRQRMNEWKEMCIQARKDRDRLRSELDASLRREGVLRDALKVAEPWMKCVIEDTEWCDESRDEHEMAKTELATVRSALGAGSEEGRKSDLPSSE